MKSYFESVHRLYKKTSRSFYALLLSVSLLCISASCTSGTDGQNDTSYSEDSLSFQKYTELLFQNEVKGDTLSLHYTLSNPAAYGITEYTVGLPDYSQDGQKQAAFNRENILCGLKSYHYDSLSLDERLTYDILSDYLSSQSTDYDNFLYDEVLRPSTGFAAQLPVLLAEYHFYHKQDVTDYLALLDAIPDCFDSVCAFEKAKSAAGLFMSDKEADKILSDCQSLCDTSKEHYLITTFQNRVNELTDLTEDERNALVQKNRKLFSSCFLPAYEKLTAQLRDLKGSGKNDGGLCYYPSGLDYYEHLVYHSTGSSHTIDELLEMTNDRRAADMSALTALTAEDPSLSLNADNFSLQDASAEDMLTFLTSAITDRFSAPVSTDFSVHYVDECMQSSMAPAFYLTAPIDDVSHNVIYINPAGGSEGVSLFTTLAHEGFPGHLYQTTKTAEASLPPIRHTLSYPGYVEGWATYVEMISYSYAELEEKQAALLMHNQSALLSLYATADLSIHGKGWTLSDLVDFFAQYGFTDKNTVSDIYDYIISEPAHYLKYYIGYLEFLELKDYANEELGSRYSDKAFHDAVLTIGPAPFSIIKKYLTNYM